MKKLLITVTAVLAALNMYGQGTVNFANGTGSRVYVDTVGGTAASLPTYAVALYYAPDGTTDESMFTMLPPQAPTFTGGIIQGGTRTAPINPAGGFGMFQIRGWTTAYGNDYESGLSAGPQAGGANKVGKSNIVRVDTGDPTTPIPGTPGALTTSGLTAFAVTTIVPEPSAIALGILGAGTLLLLRRRK
jgi:hypothetical protein